MELSNRDIYIRGTKRRSGACHAPQLSSLNGSKRHILSFELGALVFFFFFLFTVFFLLILVSTPFQALFLLKCCFGHHELCPYEKLYSVNEREW